MIVDVIWGGKTISLGKTWNYGCSKIDMDYFVRKKEFLV